MVVSKKEFDPTTEKVAARKFTFNGAVFKADDDFVAKVANASPRQLKALYSARRIKDKFDDEVKRVVKPPHVTEAQEYANALEEKATEGRVAVSAKLSHAKASILQKVADVEAEEAYDAQDTADDAKEEARKAKKAKQARIRRAKVKAAKDANKQ